LLQLLIFSSLFDAPVLAIARFIVNPLAAQVVAALFFGCASSPQGAV
jgi:hypothetical protein